ncbi:SHOCT domain-containing protein [Virgibacillus sp. MSJ-26]|nr:SHOCT domain-containing protein [Virgibacillus sp. MSJ-26]
MHGMYGYGSIWMIVFWVILIGFGIYLVKRFINGDKNSVNKNNKNTPLQTLQERLARGEIDVEEYEHLKSIIKRDKD